MMQKGNLLGSVATVLVTVRAVLLTSLDVGDRLWLRNRGGKSQRQDGQEEGGRLHDDEVLESWLLVVLR